MAAAATEMGLLPGTRSSSTAFLAMKVAAICTCLGRPRFEQKRDMKSPVVMRSTLVSSAFRISLKHLPISFFEIRETAQISVEEQRLGEGKKHHLDSFMAINRPQRQKSCRAFHAACFIIQSVQREYVDL